MGKVRQANQKEIGRVEPSDTQEPVVSLVGDERMDIRVGMKGKSYGGSTKRGVRFYLFDDNWGEFKKPLTRWIRFMRRGGVNISV